MNRILFELAFFVGIYVFGSQLLSASTPYYSRAYKLPIVSLQLLHHIYVQEIPGVFWSYPWSYPMSPWTLTQRHHSHFLTVDKLHRVC